MELLARRAMLETLGNADDRLDYVITLEGTFDLDGGKDEAIIQLRYIPDKLVLTPESFSQYLTALADLNWISLEEAAAAVLDDLNNEVVARWLQIDIKSDVKSDSGIQNHQVLLEDRQPNWDNPRLLARLKSI